MIEISNLRSTNMEVDFRGVSVVFLTALDEKDEKMEVIRRTQELKKNFTELEIMKLYSKK
jgi:ferredoxin-fold anticodon binding domain-containing protein